ncbi:MAG: M60 family metallopeptidase, partial [Armatimonadetes bacterium]|nr:M60 family metallopeptidase [Armatimonadota bacterium]
AGQRRLPAEDLAQASWSVLRTAAVLSPADKILLPRLRPLPEKHAPEALPTPEQPLKAENFLSRLALTLQVQDLRHMPPEQVKPHPAAASFPGAVPPHAPRVEKMLQVDTGVPAWHSTGLYAAPGEVIEVEVPETASVQGLSVQIGCHTDTLWHLDSWARAPDIVRSFPLTAPLTRAASAFGGLIYLVVPDGCGLDRLTVTIRGAVEAPHFILGRTTPQEWRDAVRNRPAPWAELECSKVIITVPSENLRQLDDPVPLMELWSSILDACASLAAVPLERVRPERFVTDVQISAGYMHSGYPIMTFLDVAPLFADREELFRRAADGGIWGFLHELGHNHQSPDWTFDGAGEVTVNLFSLYILDRVFNVRQAGHPAVVPAERQRVMREYFAAPSFEKWKSNPFLALYMYMQLQEAFGWETFRKVFAEYRSLADAQRPRTDDEKRDQWLVRFSRTVGRNLGPFFEAWSVPTSEAARAAIADLPPWLPPDFPPR